MQVKIWFKKLHERVLRAVIFAVMVPLIFGFSLSTSSSVEAAGVPQILSYQGRLTDSSGELLGSASGTTYYFKFSIYDAVSGGTKLWPSSAPASTSASVVSGVFNVKIGDTGSGYPDALDFNFEDDEEVYLQVEVASTSAGTYEAISPRQRITSAGYAINSKALRGFLPSQVASGSNVPVLSGGNLILGGTDPQINATSTNDLVIQGGAGTGDLILVTNGGNVGIGTTAPATKLEVASNGKIRASGSSASNYIQMWYDDVDGNKLETSNDILILQGASGEMARLTRTSLLQNSDAAGTHIVGINNGTQLQYDSSSGLGGLVQPGNYALRFSTNNTERMRIDNSGNVGIGTTAPSSTLHVLGSGITSSTSALTIANASATPILFARNDGNVVVGSSTAATLFSVATSSNIFNVTSAGRVGIGTGSPNASSTLHVAAGNSGGNLASAGLLVSGGSGNGGGTLWLGSDPYYKGVFNYSYDDKLLSIHGGQVIGNIALLTSSGEVMRLNSSGNVGIGTASPSSTLHVVGDFQVSSTAFYVSSTTGRVGIGTSTPSYQLDIVSADSLTSPALRLMNPNSGYAANSATIIDFHDGTGAQRLNMSRIASTRTLGMAGALDFHTTDSNGALTNSFRVLSSGPSALGTSSIGASATLNFIHGNNVQASIQTYLNSGWPTDLLFKTATGEGSGLSERLRITSTGNVGIGTASPSSTLHVLGSGITSSTSALTIANASATPILFARNDGSVGIGTATPQYKLDLDGVFHKTYRTDTNSNNYLLGSGYELDGTSHGAGGYTLYQRWGDSGYGDGGWSMVYGTAAHPVLTLGSGGATIGGTGYTAAATIQSDTSASLNVHSNTNAAGAYSGVFFKVATHSQDRRKAAVLFESSGDITGRGSLHLAVDTANDDNPVQVSDAKLTIDSSGNVGIGTTAPSSTLHVVGETNSSGGFTVASGASGSGLYNTYLNVRGDKNSDVGSYLDFRDNRFSINNLGNGGVQIRVGNTTSTQNPLVVTNDGNVVVGSSTAATLFSVATSSNIFNVTSAGRVGVGTAVPGVLLQVGQTGYGSEGSTFSGQLNVFNNAPDGQNSLDVNLVQSQNWGGGTNNLNFIRQYNNGATPAGWNLGSINFKGWDGSSVRPVAGIASYPDNDIVSTSSPGYLVFSTTPSGGVAVQERVRITSAGNVGIGTSTPSSTLHVVGGFEVSSGTTKLIYVSSTNGYVGIGTTIRGASGLSSGPSLTVAGYNGNTGNGQIVLGDDPYYAGLLTYTYQQGLDISSGFVAGGISLSTSLQPRINITSDGLVGIGTTAPSSTLHVVGGFEVSSGTTKLVYVSSTSGYVGIGTSTPSTPLYVVGTSTIAGNLMPGANNTYDLGSTSMLWKSLHVASGSIVVHADTTNTLKYTLDFTGTTARIVSDAATPIRITTGSNTGLNIDTSGNVGIGVTGGGALLDVAGTLRVGGNFTANNTTVDTSATGGTLIAGAPCPGATLTGNNIAILNAVAATPTTNDIFYNTTIGLHSRITSVTICAGNEKYLALTDTITGQVTGNSWAIYTPVSNIGNGTSGFFNNMYAVNYLGLASTLAGGFDVAEQYPTYDESIEAGDVVTMDSSEPLFIKKATGGYDNKLVGVISTNPALTFGNNRGDNWRKVALAGRVPVKISFENGEVAPGDYLTSSATKPGYAMKMTESGVAIGMALESASGDTETVMMMVRTGYQYVGPVGGPMSASLQGEVFASAQVSAFERIDVSVARFGVDAIGQAEILPGNTRVEVVFEQPYEYKPIVTITPTTLANVRYAVTQTTVDGFTIEIDSAQNEAVGFNWHAFESVSEAKIYVSDGSTRLINVVVVDEPANERDSISDLEPATESEPELAEDQEDEALQDEETPSGESEPTVVGSEPAPETIEEEAAPTEGSSGATSENGDSDQPITESQQDQVIEQPSVDSETASDVDVI